MKEYYTRNIRNLEKTIRDFTQETKQENLWKQGKWEEIKSSCMFLESMKFSLYELKRDFEQWKQFNL